MKKVNILAILIAIVLIVTAVVLVGWHMVKSEPVLIQGTVECTSYKASSKIPGRIDALKVRQGDKVEKGQLLYVLSTPELNAKLQQAEAVRSAAKAIDDKALAGARSQQIEAALNLWQKAQAGKELAAKTYERVQNLYRDGVVPAQKLDEAKANYDAMVATESAAHSQYELAVDGASKEDKAAAAAQVRQAQGAVNEVEAYISDAMVYSPVTGEVSTVISEAGELVGSGYPVITILDLSDMWVTFNVREDLLQGKGKKLPPILTELPPFGKSEFREFVYRKARELYVRNFWLSLGGKHPRVEDRDQFKMLLEQKVKISTIGPLITNAVIQQWLRQHPRR